MQATTKLWRPGILFLVALNLLLGLSPAAPNEPSFTTIDFPGATYTQASGINPKGEIVGFYADTGGTLHGFLLSKGGFTSIDFPGAINTLNFWNTPGGAMVGLYDSADGKSHGFLRTTHR